VYQTTDPIGELVRIHNLGDQHAEKILSGAIPFDEARRQERDTQRQLDEMCSDRRCRTPSG